MKRIALVIPCYNEEKDIAASIEKIKEFLSDIKDYQFFIVPVDDGSKDSTKAIITSIKDINPISYSPNRGKGGAVKAGIEYSFNELNVDYVIFMDADLSTDLLAIKKCIDLLEKNYGLVVASRYNPDSLIKVKQPFKRRLISKCSRIIISSMFHFKLKDTQCGFKGMNKEIGQLFLDKSKINGFSFDVELIYIAKLNGKKYVSMPVTWANDEKSTVSGFKTSMRFFKDLFKIKRWKKEYLIK